jgi:predicted DNA-binding protein YlxM (UPF0122 family)
MAYKSINVTEEMVDSWEDLYLKDHESFATIGSKFDVSGLTVSRYLKKRGAPLRKYSSKSKRKLALKGKFKSSPKMRILMDSEETVKRMYLEDKKDVIEIAGAFNVSPQTVRKALHTWGIKLRWGRGNTRKKVEKTYNKGSQIRSFRVYGKTFSFDVDTTLEAVTKLKGYGFDVSLKDVLRSMEMNKEASIRSLGFSMERLAPENSEAGAIQRAERQLFDLMEKYPMPITEVETAIKSHYDTFKEKKEKALEAIQDLIKSANLGQDDIKGLEVSESNPVMRRRII